MFTCDSWSAKTEIERWLGEEMRDWIKASIALTVFGFINLILFIVLSEPTIIIFNSLKGNSTQINSTFLTINPILNMIRMVFGITFVLSMVGLIVWFFLGSHDENDGEHY